MSVKYTSNVDATIRAIDTGIRNGHRLGYYGVIATAQSLARVDTGEMRNAYTTVIENDRQVTVGNIAQHFKYQESDEFNPSIKGMRSLEQSFDANKGNIESVYSREVKNALRGVG